MMPTQSTPEQRIQALADVLSLVAIIGLIDKAAIQRVLISLGSVLLDVQTTPIIDQNMARRLLSEIAREVGEDAALHIASDMAFVARAWRPVLEEHLPLDPYRLMPYAEIIYALVNHSGIALQQYEVLDRFGGAEFLIPFDQLSAALSTYAVPKPALKWELVGFREPSDQALVASGPENIYLFKAASSATDLRFSELGNRDIDDHRREHDVKVDSPLFAAFLAGLLGDMLYWAARLRAHTLPGHEIWQRIQTLLVTPTSTRTSQLKPSSPDKKVDAEPKPTTEQKPVADQNAGPEQKTA
ncbi:MAG: hypothetical protein JXB07_12405 [Anaerolineae bacterium]|nr:hypothetical protein [Anaerolineae bacterium]